MVLFSLLMLIELHQFDLDELPERGCTSITVQALKAGHTTLTATYAYADFVLRASIVIGVYYPVKVI